MAGRKVMKSQLGSYVPKAPGQPAASQGVLDFHCLFFNLPVVNSVKTSQAIYLTP